MAEDQSAAADQARRRQQQAHAARAIHGAAPPADAPNTPESLANMFKNVQQRTDALMAQSIAANQVYLNQPGGPFAQALGLAPPPPAGGSTVPAASPPLTPQPPVGHAPLPGHTPVALVAPTPAMPGDPRNAQPLMPSLFGWEGIGTGQPLVVAHRANIDGPIVRGQIALSEKHVGIPVAMGVRSEVVAAILDPLTIAIILKALSEAEKRFGGLAEKRVRRLYLEFLIAVLRARQDWVYDTSDRLSEEKRDLEEKSKGSGGADHPDGEESVDERIKQIDEKQDRLRAEKDELRSRLDELTGEWLRLELR